VICSPVLNPQGALRLHIGARRIQNEAQVGSIIVGNGYPIDDNSIGIGWGDDRQWLV
jgi:hypothetical protein